MHAASYVIALPVALFASQAAIAQSTCYGSTANGAVTQACKLAASGANFMPYSNLGRWLGRTWVHCEVAGVVADAYQTLAAQLPQKRFVYGETGLKRGGQFKPHKTHQNGLSVDFMVPVTNARGISVALPTGLTNKFGYAIEFDAVGQFADLQIDFEALGAHLLALQRTAIARGIQIDRVIFAPELQLGLRRTTVWADIQNLEFSRKTAWVRHDEHYHVDFRIPCHDMSQRDRR